MEWRAVTDGGVKKIVEQFGFKWRSLQLSVKHCCFLQQWQRHVLLFSWRFYTTKLVYRKHQWTSNLLQDVVIHFRNEVTLALHLNSFRRNHAPRHTRRYSPSRMLHYKATRKRIQVLSITTGRAIRKHSSAIWHKRKTMSSHNGTCKDRASMLLMYQTVSYLSEVFHRLQLSSMMIEWLALHIAAASQIEDSYPHFSPLKLGVKLVKRRRVLIKLMTWRLTWKLQRIIYQMESLCRWEEDEI